MSARPWIHGEFRRRPTMIHLHERCTIDVPLSTAYRGDTLRINSSGSKTTTVRCSRRAGPDGLCWQHRTRAVPPVSPEEQAFLSAIEADLSDATTKLVYADWLDDRGRPEAKAWRWMVKVGSYPIHEDGLYYWQSRYGTVTGTHNSKTCAVLWNLPLKWSQSYRTLRECVAHLLRGL